MPKIFNQNQIPQKKNNPPLPDYSWAATEDLAKLANLTDFCCNIRSLEKGKFSYPYHYHHNAEEMFVILSGEGELRTPDGITKLKTGDIALFEKGATGAHQLFNPDSTPLVYLDLGTKNKIDICEYPDTGKMLMLPSKDIFYRGENTQYFEGEENIKEV
jgi:uncharacterized cupin superfamily protein